MNEPRPTDSRTARLAADAPALLDLVRDLTVELDSRGIVPRVLDRGVEVCIKYGVAPDRWSSDSARDQVERMREAAKQ